MEDLLKISQELLKQPKKGKHSISEDEFKKELKVLTTEFQLEFTKIGEFMGCLIEGISTLIQKVNSIETDIQSLKKSGVSR